ncbi:MAG: hypothetical protein K9J37_14465 [Saprospiraceae bacterium]|nr:hypothetical protein [Saprospiraceae bacterium]MCF8251111.1 hypothetical protein [Saprospiraceae bacterium]MCF8281013.1 hypothetical protein [Bacteroidales bacterium]MCF8312931.1 hypothetical protein [Saprospiraceae bacterium]MCF8441370.1 hypothetical protein [Saprospiraceae bacterium]
MDKRQHTEKIEAYLTGQLVPAEAQLFEQAIAKDENLAMEVEMQRLEHDAMELMLEKDLKSKMGKWKDNPPPNPFEENPTPVPLPVKNSWRRWLPLLGVAVLVLGSVYYFSKTANNQPVDTPASETPKQEQTPSVPIANEPAEIEQTSPPSGTPAEPKVEKQKPQQGSAYLALAINEYETPTFNSGQRGNGTELSLLEEAEAAFDEKRYSKTIELLARQEAGNESQVRYLRGHAYFKLKKYKQAATEFEPVAANGFAPSSQDAKWYLMLTYLAQVPDERSRFHKLAEEIADQKNKHARQTEAAKLLAQVKVLK